MGSWQARSSTPEERPYGAGLIYKFPGGDISNTRMKGKCDGLLKIGWVHTL